MKKRLNVLMAVSVSAALLLGGCSSNNSNSESKSANNQAAANKGTEEKIVHFDVDGQKVVGTLVLPEGIKRPPVVLMLHGFTGTRDDWKSKFVPEGLFGRAAPIFAKNGIATLRIDFRGSGDSDGKFEDMTVESEVKDALAAVDYLASSPDVSKSISVMGMSLGGAVSTAVAGRSTVPVHSLVLWNPGINLPAAFTTIFGEKGMVEGTQAGDKVYTAIRLGDNKPIPLRGRFFESLYEVVPAAELEKYKGPVFLAVGTKDTIVFPQPITAKALLAYHDGQEELWTRPVDHGFNLMENANTVDDLIRDTVRFVKTSVDG
ncbi:alpha/beta hydrolase family protein [Paenibacillus beijingensis]|uniref:alpha/beta hydrolase family protein n=1 Tax=Paenibacillus beijingensis TaxID=1126833 RepID=UPI000696A830|nr:alpha/beta fold hydrolase [Paenibacillus beijingensis]